MKRSFLSVLIAVGMLMGAERSPLDHAWDLLRKGQRTEAVEVLRGLLRSHPENAEAHLLLGSVLMEAGQGEESVAQLKEAVRLRPKSVEAQNALGEAYNAAGDPKSARGPFEKAVALDPKFAPARLGLGSVLLQLNDSAAAAPHLDRAIALLGKTPDAGYALYLRAKIYSEQGETEKAASELKQAVNLQPNLAQAWSDLGEAREALLDDAGALEALERAVKISPEDAIAQTRLGTVLLDQGRAHEAVSHFEQAARLSPADQSVLNGLQRALRADGQAAQADAVKQRLTELFRAKSAGDQNSVAAIRLNNEGAALEKAGNLRGALAKYQAALALWPDHIGIRTNVAAALLHVGQWQAGVDELREVLRRDPGNEPVKAALEQALAHGPPR